MNCIEFIKTIQDNVPVLESFIKHYENDVTFLKERKENVEKMYTDIVKEIQIKQSAIFYANNILLDNLTKESGK